MSELDHWLRREARREARRTTLEDALLFGPFYRYVWHRSRRFLATRLTQELLHIGELYLLFLFATENVFLTAALVTFAARTFAAGWWGVLEILRKGVRDRAQDGRYADVGRWILGWIARASLAGLAVTCAVIGFAITRLATTGLDVGEAYLVVWCLGYALELPVRALHAGAYSLRRVYQPTWALLTASLLRAASLVALWPFAGVWSIVAASACSVVSTAALTLFFARRTYIDLRLWPLARSEPDTRAWATRLDVWQIVQLALAGASTAVGHLFGVIVLFSVRGASGLWLGLFLYLVLAAPLAEASVAWSRLFYPDLAKLDNRLSLPFKCLLEGQLKRWSAVVGIVLWLPSILIIVMVADRWLLTSLATVALFVVRARLAAMQLIAFCNRRYVLLAGFSATLAIATIVPAQLDAAWVGWTLVATLLTLMLSVVLPARPPDVEPLVPMASLIATARGFEGDGHWTLGEFRPGPLLHGPLRVLQQAARRSGPIGLDRDRWLLRWHPVSGASRSRGDVLDAVQLIRWRSPAASALDGLRGLAAGWPRTRMPGPQTLELVNREFRSRFADGVCLVPGTPVPRMVRGRMTWRERKCVLGEASQHVFGRPPRVTVPFDVSALVDRGCIAAIYLVPRTVPSAARRRWRAWLRDVSLANAFSMAIESEASATRPARRLANTRQAWPWRYWGLPEAD